MDGKWMLPTQKGVCPVCNHETWQLLDNKTMAPSAQGECTGKCGIVAFIPKEKKP